VSAAPRHGGNWFNQNYEKLVLFIVLVMLFGSALLLILETGRVRQTLNEARWEKPDVSPKMVQPAALATYDAMRASSVQASQTSGGRTNRLLGSELRVSCIECGKPIPFDASKCPFCGGIQPSIADIDRDGDSLPDKFENEQGLNPLDPGDALKDLDGDGFSNMEEYQSKTDLKNPADFPPPAAKLRVVRVVSNPFKLRFQGDAKLPGGKVRYQLNLRSLERTYFVSVGDELEGVKVMEYIPDSPDGPTLILKQGDATVRLMKGKEVTKFERVADILFLIDLTPFRVRVSDVMKLKDREYKIIDIRRDGVLIRDVTTKKDVLVGPLTGSERTALQSGLDMTSKSSAVPPGAPGPQP
jgi:hypothetical protein